jgi:hypothetical protein
MEPASDEALDHAITALSKATGFLLVTYQISEKRMGYSLCSSNLIDQALLTKIAEAYLNQEMHDITKPEADDSPEEGEDDLGYGS